MIHVYQTTHVASRTVCAAFAAGCEGRITGPAPLRDGAVAMYGCLRGLLPTLRQAQSEGRDWYYLDNAYFKPGHFNGYFRATRGAYQHDGSGDGDKDRWERLGLRLAPWRASGGHILVCPPSQLYSTMLMKMNADTWLRETLATLRRYTERPLRVRLKVAWQQVKHDRKVPLADDLRDAWALVTHSSNAAVEAATAGVPVFTTYPCGASAVGLMDLSRIEQPAMPDREPWVRALAARQWTLEEMKRGLAWSYLKPTA